MSDYQELLERALERQDAAAADRRISVRARNLSPRTSTTPSCAVRSSCSETPT
jgi:hypothetical protein